MPRSLSEGFEQFHFNLKPKVAVTEAATKHRASIKTSLEKIYTLDYFFQSGSSGNATDIAYFSDVDYMAIIPTKQLTTNSQTMLTKVRDVLDSSFPRTNVHVRTPAVVVPFGYLGRETTEIVPGDLRLITQEGYHVYEIADGNGGWIKTAPKAHNKYVTDINALYDFKVKVFVRFIKAWKYYNSAEISSFYLEMRAAKYTVDYCKNSRALNYIVDLHYFFKSLYDMNLPRLQDPTGLVGYIAPCSTEIKRQASLKKLANAVSRSEKAMNASINGNEKDAFYWLNLLFNNQFPGYYY